MKLLRAKFENFRLLRDLEIEFSIDPDRKLTVIRAENETGKTTILTALQWAFYGDVALPGNAKTYRLHPIDSAEGVCRTSVEVDFETIPVLRRKEATPTPKRFRVIRTAIETLSGTEWKRSEPLLRLYELTKNGAEPQEHEEHRLRLELPPELREVFFTDGDRALSFIEADSTTVKRQRVENAIKALLGLSVLETAAGHVQRAASEVNKKVRNSDTSNQVQHASKLIEKLDEEIADLEPKQVAALADVTRCEDQYERLTKQIEAAVAKGDRSQLVPELHRIRNNRKRQEDLQLALARRQGELLKSKVLARQLLSEAVVKVGEKLEGLKQQGRIPNQTIPVLRDCLHQGVCICGEQLNLSNNESQKRRDHIEKMIEASRSADAVQKTITELYYGAQDFFQSGMEETWKDESRDLLDQRNKVDGTIRDLGAQEAEVEAKIAAIPDVDIQSMREQRKVARRHIDDNQQKATSIAIKLDNAHQERKRAEKERDALMTQEDKGQRLLAELHVGQDVLKILQRSLERLKYDELKRVSELMNKIFLEMIGADEAQGAIIRRAEISPEFDILVFGPDDRHLNPDRDLNGASRRALTLAFILALTKISGVEAPNIIDTPLGMMSGYVKGSAVQVGVQYSSQLVLFLTRSEIAGTELLLDRYAGKVITLTNPAHYPRMLLNQPKSTVVQVLRCDCSYDQHCEICERRMDVSALAQASEAAE